MKWLIALVVPLARPLAAAIVAAAADALLDRLAHPRDARQGVLPLDAPPPAKSGSSSSSPE